MSRLRAGRSQSADRLSLKFANFHQVANFVGLIAGAVCAAAAVERPQLLIYAIVLLILLTLAALMLPAVQVVAIASLNLRCANNLKLIGLALHNYHDSQTALPAGRWGPAGLPAGRCLGWQAAILPYLAEQALHERLDPTQPWDDPANHAAALTPLQCFTCPLNGFRARPGGAALTHYVGMAGVGPDAATLPADSPAAGAIGDDRRLRLRDVADGTAVTIAALETMQDEPQR